MRKAISIGLIFAACTGRAAAVALNDVDAAARAEGSRKQEAVAIGRALFTTVWPAQVLRVRVDGSGNHEVAGLIVSGVKFHHRMTRAAFLNEIAGLVERAFRVSRVEEVDVWSTVPLWVGKGAVVSGDLAIPTSRTVFTITVRRSESTRSVRRRLFRRQDVYWDRSWARRVFVAH